RNPESETRNPNPETQNTKNEIRNTKPGTRNPKPESRKPRRRLGTPGTRTRRRCCRVRVPGVQSRGSYASRYARGRDSRTQAKMLLARM
ncbi:hypothetical protein T484DRAFT_1636234, partial [Baffinella frigidus]